MLLIYINSHKMRLKKKQNFAFQSVSLDPFSSAGRSTLMEEFFKSTMLK